MKFMLGAGVFLLGVALAQAVEVREVRVRREGGAPIEEEAVRAYLGIQAGQDLSRAVLARDVRTLEESGRFSFVATEVADVADGVNVTYVVRPRMIASRVRVEGAEEIGNQKALELLELKAGQPFDEAMLAQKAQTVKEHYRKQYYPFTELEWTITEQPESGRAEVLVRVEEGRRVKVKDIQFSGLTEVKPAAIREAMTQKRRTFWSWITGTGTYEPSDLDADREVIRRVLMEAGYLDAKVGDPAVEMEGKKARITVPLEQGPRYALGGITVSGPKQFGVEQVSASVTSKPGDVASITAIEGARQGIRDFYGSRGYISTEVRQRMVPRPGEPVVDLAYEVAEGGIANIRDIRIRGNTKTKDKVIRRELTVYPGEIYNTVKVRTSERRLRNLGYFEFANAVPEATKEPDLYDVAFEVEEKSTGQFLVGAGFSSVENLFAFAELSQGNFDLFSWPPVGAGQKLSLRGTVGTERTDAEISFVEPWFLDRKLSLGINLFSRDKRYLSSEYNQQDLGFNVRLGRPLGTYSRVNLTYGLEQIDIYDVSTNASELIRAEEGVSVKSYVGLEVVRDTRDNSFIPSRGSRNSAGVTYAGGPLGGDVDIYQLEAQSSYFFPLWFRHVFNLRSWASVVDAHGEEDRVPIFDRLFLGGARTLRGFKYRKVGPKDENGEAIGGRTAWYVTAEYTVPVVEKVRFATFYDIGLVNLDAYDWETVDYNSDWGVGIRLDIPGFPLRFDYAWPIVADELNDDPNGRFQFNIGYSY